MHILLYTEAMRFLMPLPSILDVVGMSLDNIDQAW